MKQVRTKEELEDWKNHLPLNSTIGFVPTMGALHTGHISLADRSVKDNDFTVVSIFVNPTQFNNPTDLEKYPVTIEEDLKMLEAAGVDVAFTPTVATMYPNGAVAEHFDFGPIANEMEGEHRPGHFDGVGTVVGRLFELTTPTKSYFGEKDFQQFRIVEKLKEIKNYAVEVVPCAIAREPNGLAMSSRNKRLTAIAKENSSIIYKTLLKGQHLFKNGVPINDIQAELRSDLNQDPLFELEYLNIAKVSDLKFATEKDRSEPLRLFVAGFVEGVRLIDNIELSK